MPSEPASWSPPAGYVPAPSTVAGIELWRPAPEAEASTAQETTRCPQCGASAAFDVGVAALACRFCGFTRAVEAAPAARASAERQDEFTLEALARFEHGWGVARRELACGTCGATIAVDDRTIATTCPFCTSNHVNLQTATAAGIRPRALVPFAVKEGALAEAVRAYLADGWMFPPDLAEAAKADRFVGIYAPFWVFDARIDGRWRAEIGHRHTKTVWVNGKAKTRTEIRWRWETGGVTDAIGDLQVPGTPRLSDRLAARIPFSLADLRPYDPAFLAGWRAMAYETALPEAWTRGRERMREQSHASNHADAASRTGHVRSFSLVADFEDERWRYVLLPVYVSAYRYGDRTWQVLVNGQTGVVSGSRPVAWRRVQAAIAAALLPGVFVGVCLGVPLLGAAGAGVIAMLLGVVLFVAGALWGRSVWTRALDAEAE